jgi:lipopolysaccharide heptosyltransferase II
MPPQRFLVVLPNWFGETLFATPFLRTLRTQHPDAWIATLGWPPCRQILLHNPRVNELLDYDELGADRGAAGAWRLAGRLRARRFDRAYILRRSLSRTALLALAGIRQRIGFANAKSGWLLTRAVPPPAAGTHRAAGYIPLAMEPGGGAGPAEPRFEYCVGPDEQRWAETALGQLGVLDGRPLVVLHPGANWPHKRWAPERFGALGDRLAQTRGAHLLVTGGPGDMTLAGQVGQAMRQPAHIMAGQTSVRQLAAVLARARALVSNDTGILHIAAALGTPLVGLYGPTSPAITGPLGDPAVTRVVHHPECCPQIPCYQPDRPAHAGMDSITVDEAFQEASRLLDAAPDHAARS